MIVIFGILQILAPLCIAVGFFSIFNSNRRIIKSNVDLLTFVKEDLLRMYMITGLLQMQCSNPIIFEICEELKRRKGSELPKNDKDFRSICHTASKKFYEKMWTILNNKIQKAENPDEKIYYQNRLSKLSSAMDILESISEDSSNDYLKQVMNEIAHLFSENEEV